jgi:sugar/nucleoside kinase (ribokinase family)
MEKTIACLGIMVADVVAKPLKAMPERGKLVLVDEMSLHTGGCAINAATALARLGLPVEVIGKVGADQFGDFLLTELQQRHIGKRGVSRHPTIGTSATMVMVEEDGERRFVHYIGANAELKIEDINLDLLQEFAIIHVAGSLVLPGLDGTPSAHLLKSAQATGVVTFLDTVWDDTGRWMKVLEPCLPHIDYFIPSLPEAQAITGEDDPYQAARILVEAGVATVALKMGEDGCLVMVESGETIQHAAFKVDVIDATGAGDAFAAGFIAGVYMGWELPDTIRLANATGALSVTGLGASGGVTTLDETIKFMSNTPLRK